MKIYLWGKREQAHQRRVSSECLLKKSAWMMCVYVSLKERGSFLLIPPSHLWRRTRVGTHRHTPLYFCLPIRGGIQVRRLPQAIRNDRVDRVCAHSSIASPLYRDHCNLAVCPIDSPSGDTRLWITTTFAVQREAPTKTWATTTEPSKHFELGEVSRL